MMRAGRSAPAVALPLGGRDDGRSRHGEPPEKRARGVLLGCARRPVGAALVVMLVSALATALLLAVLPGFSAMLWGSVDPKLVLDPVDFEGDAVPGGAAESRRVGGVAQSPPEPQAAKAGAGAGRGGDVARVVVMVPHVEAVTPARLTALLQSLGGARYPATGDVALDVYVRSPAAGALSGVLGIGAPPPAQAALEKVAQGYDWPHGPKFVAAYAGVEWAARLEDARAVLVFADAAARISPAYFDFLRQGSEVVLGTGTVPPAGGAPILAVSLDSVVPAGGVVGNASASAARLGSFFPGASAFAPTPDAWSLFVRWLSLRASHSFRAAVPSQGGFPVVAAPVPAESSYEWKEDIRVVFAEFLHLYGGHVLHPVVDDGNLLVFRDPVALSFAERAGDLASAALAGAAGPVSVSGKIPLRLRTKSATGPCCQLLEHSVTWPFSMPRKMPVLSLDGEPVADKRAVPVGYPMSLLGGSKKVPMAPVLSAEERVAQEAADAVHDEAVERIARYARKRGDGVIAFTLVTEAFVETTYSWICNALAVDALPKALVFGASDADVVRSLESLFANDTRVTADYVMVVDLSSAVHAVQNAKTPQAGLDFGSSEYWQLMLERTTLLRDVLDAGVSILHFETDQIWFGDPMTSINALLAVPVVNPSANDLSAVDMIVTINTREEASGNFFFLRPTLATRHLWSLVTGEFWASYRRSRSTTEAKEGKWHYIDNDQSLFTRYGLGNDAWFTQTFPGATYSVLDRERFVDGTWYLDFEDESGAKPFKRSHYTSRESLSPVVLNNNFMIGVGPKKERARRFGHWFWDESNFACNASRGTRPGQVPVVAV